MFRPPLLLLLRVVDVAVGICLYYLVCLYLSVFLLLVFSILHNTGDSRTLGACYLDALPLNYTLSTSKHMLFYIYSSAT